ncbi:MAG: HIT family protein [Thermoplasmata archaeon]
MVHAPTPTNVETGSTSPPTDCEFCRRLEGPSELRDRVVYEDDFFLAAHRINDEDLTFRGYLLIQTKRHVSDLASLTNDEAVRLGYVLTTLSRALKECTGAAWEYCFSFTEGCRHVHFHLASRYAGLPKEFVRLEFAAWPGAPRSDRDGIVRLSKELAAVARMSP